MCVHKCRKHIIRRAMTTITLFSHTTYDVRMSGRRNSRNQMHVLICVLKFAFSSRSFFPLSWMLLSAICCAYALFSAMVRELMAVSMQPYTHQLRGLTQAALSIVSQVFFSVHIIIIPSKLYRRGECKKNPKKGLCSIHIYIVYNMNVIRGKKADRVHATRPKICAKLREQRLHSFDFTRFGLSTYFIRLCFCFKLDRVLIPHIGCCC